MPDDGDRASFDLIVVGAGPGGEVVASRLAGTDLRIALVERELVGGECAYWACIPSKTLLRPSEVRYEAERAAGTSAPDQRWSAVAAYRDYMIRHLDDSHEPRIPRSRDSSRPATGPTARPPLSRRLRTA